jgi:hypothetical protein
MQKKCVSHRKNIEEHVQWIAFSLASSFAWHYQPWQAVF